MGALSIPEPTGLRYALYIQELREFFAFSGLAYGSPDDVFAVIERIQNNPSFAEDLSSLVRAAILREGGSMPHGQLLEILAIAVGGPAMEHAPQTHRAPLRQLLAFLTGVLRRPWNLPPGERAEVLPFPTELPPAPPEAKPLATAQPETPAPQAAAAPVPAAPAKAPPFAATNLATALLKATALEVASPETPSPVVAPLEVSPPETAFPEVAVLEAAPLAIAPLEAISFDSPEPPQQSPAPQLEVHEEPPDTMPVLATAVQPEPEPPLEPQQSELSESHESLPLVPLLAQPDPIQSLANLLEPRSDPGSALGLEPPPDQESAEADRSAADQAEDRAPTFAPWVVPQRSPRPMNPQPRRMAWIYRPMREIAAVGVCALLIAGLVAVALRPGSSLSSETQPAPTPDPNHHSSPDPISAGPAPVATLPVPSVPAAADPGPSRPAQPTPTQPSPGNHPPVAASTPTADSAQKPHTGVSDRDYIAPPTAHYYNGWGPASQAAATKPVSPASAPTAAAASASPAASTKSEQSYGPYQPAAPIERRPGTSSLVTPGDVPTAPHLFALASSALAPNLISAPFPEYPRLARIAHVQGPVVVDALIDKDGTVTVTRVVSGHRLLRSAAVSAIQRWLYRPYRVDGHPVQVSTTLTVTVAPRLSSSY